MIQRPTMSWPIKLPTMRDGIRLYVVEIDFSKTEHAMFCRVFCFGFCVMFFFFVAKLETEHFFLEHMAAASSSSLPRLRSSVVSLLWVLLSFLVLLVVVL